MDEFEFQDPQLASYPQASLNLSIQLSGEFLSFAIQDAAYNTLLYLKHIPFEEKGSREMYAENIVKIIDSESRLNGEFSTVKLMWISDKYTLVPHNYSEETILKQLFQLVHPLNELDELHLTELHDSKYKLLFSFPQELAHELVKHFPKIQIFNQLNLLHVSQGKIRKDQEGSAIIVQVYKDFCDIAVYQNQSIKLANPFPLQEKTDLVYNLLNICKHFEIDPAQGTLTVTDHYLHGLTGHDSLKKYFQNITFIKPDVPETNLSLFQQQDISRYVNLLNLIHCV